MRGITKKINRKKKHYYQLFTDVNAIPKGVYRLIDKQDLGYVFRVGRNIQFLISDHESVRLKKVKPKEAQPNLTTTQEFLDRYYQLLATQKSYSTFDPTKPITACMISPELARELH